MLFLYQFLWNFWRRLTSKMVLPSRRNAIFCKIDVQKHPPNPSQINKNQWKIYTKKPEPPKRPIFFRSFPTFSNIFRSFPTFFQKSPAVGQILSLPPQTCSAKAGPKSAGRTILQIIAPNPNLAITHPNATCDTWVLELSQPPPTRT